MFSLNSAVQTWDGFFEHIKECPYVFRNRIYLEEITEKNFYLPVIYYSMLVGGFCYNRRNRLCKVIFEDPWVLREKEMKGYETSSKSNDVGLYVDAGDVEHEFRHVDRYC